MGGLVRERGGVRLDGISLLALSETHPALLSHSVFPADGVRHCLDAFGSVGLARHSRVRRKRALAQDGALSNGADSLPPDTTSARAGPARHPDLRRFLRN